jgi:23S rRNA (cytosine1962-C5)-methyltransferase
MPPRPQKFERPQFDRRPAPSAAGRRPSPQPERFVPRGAPVRFDLSQRSLDETRGGDQLPVVVLKTSTLHPNLFRKRIQVPADNIGAGDLVAVDLPDGSRLGYGLFNPVAEIAIRMLSWGDRVPDAAYWRETLVRACHLRTNTLKLNDIADTYRVLNGESDGIPGLVIDRYGDVLSVEAFSLGAFQRAEATVKLLGELLGTSHYVIRTSPHSEEQEGFGAPTIVSENCPKEVVVQEYGTRFKVRFEGGHKTGFFCDQRENRFKLAQHCAGKSVLDLCCYTGGFAVQAKKLGQAAEVTAVELDEEPLKIARLNANQNQVKVNFVQSDVFPYMRDMLKNGRRFDVVVLDPPKLIRSREEVEEGSRKHLDLNRLAMQLVKPDGLLLTCTCAGLLGGDEFQSLVCSAARQSGGPLPSNDPETRPRNAPRDMQILARTGAGPDHPIGGNCPESEYLKAFWIRML